MSTSKQRPIGVFDSGVGGLTNVRALMERLPMENIIYFGDTARVPYGTKSRATIETFAMQIVDFLLETMSKHWLSRATLSPPLPDRKSAKKQAICPYWT